MARSWPSSVGRRGRLPLMKIGSPRRFSMNDILREIAGCDKPSIDAASVMPP